MKRLSVQIFDPNPPWLIPDTDKIANALKNTVLHPIDLLVRETIQNSIDAAAEPKRSDKDIRVEFMRGDFDIRHFIGCMDADCGSKLDEYLRRHQKPLRYFAIRDTNCTGLTGVPRDRESNLHKLIYGFLGGKGSTAEEGGKGGSFGVGKTVFLRFGIGFVIYYSRIADGHSRLAMFYCRNSREDKIFPEMPHQLAWWGRVEEGVAYPVEDDDIINDVLSVFKIPAYGPRETGTTVIIPFFDEQVPKEDGSGFKPWENSFDKYLRYSVLKWYVPRYRADLKTIANESGEDFREYKWGPYLRCAFPDREPISREIISEAERKIFGLIRDLYDVAIGKCQESDNILRYAVTSNDYPSRGVCFDTENIGWLAIKRINYISGEYADTLTLLNALVPEREIGDRKGLLLYCRQPGMIVTYDDSWDKVFSKAKNESGEFLIGIFVVNSDCNVYADKNHRSLIGPLDMLFRETENTDHYGWSPDAQSHGVGLIKRIVNNLQKGVAGRFGESEVLPETTPKGDISRGLGCVFQSGREGFGGTQLFPEGNGGVDEVNTTHKGGAVRKKCASVSFADPAFTVADIGVVVSVPVAIKGAENDLNVNLAVAVEMDKGGITEKDWDRAAGDFPITACDFIINEGRANVTKSQGGCRIVMEMASPIVRGVLSYRVARTDMSTVVVRQED